MGPLAASADRSFFERDKRSSRAAYCWLGRTAAAPGDGRLAQSARGIFVPRARRSAAPPRLFVFGVSAWFALAPMSTVVANASAATPPIEAPASANHQLGSTATPAPT